MSNPVIEPSVLRSRLRSAPARALVRLVQLYRVWISPLTLPSCRFEPTCSGYAVEALTQRGAVVGVGLAVVRVLKCAPWHPGGWDPVPERRSVRRARVSGAAEHGAADEHQRDETSRTRQDELRSE